MTTITALTHPRFRLAAGPPWRAFLLGFGLTLLLGLLAAIGASGAVALSHTKMVMPNVSVGGVEVGNLTREQAAAKLESELPSLQAGGIVVRVGEDEARLSLGAVTDGYDMDAMLSGAFSVARDGNPLTDAAARLRSLVRSTTIAVALAPATNAALDDAVNSLVDRFSVTAVDAHVVRKGSVFAVAEAVPGRSVDAQALRAALLSAPAAPTGEAISVEPQLVEPRITTAEAQAAAEQARWMASAPLILYGAGREEQISTDDLAALISFGTADGGYAAQLDEAGLRGLIDPLRGDFARKPRDAAYRWDASGISGVVPAVVGRRLNVDRSTANAMQVLESRAAGSFTASAALVISARQPALSTKAATAAATQMRQLGTWTTWYVPGDGNYWGANISIPAQDLDRMVIAPGEWFSFWNDIGPVTLARGYGYGGVIIGGRSVANGAIAGGICSTSTTLFNAAMRAGLEIGDRANHSYYIERYPLGLDATVLKTDTWAQDMTFRNDTDNPIIIRSYTASGMVRFDIWGVPDGRTVSLSTPVKRNYHTAHWTTVVNPDLKPGTSVIREYTHDGFDTSVTRTVRDADGNVLHLDTWFSHYNTVNGITEVGPKKHSAAA